MRQLGTLIAALSALALSGCVVVPVPRHGGYYAGAASGGSGVMVTAPAPYVEVMPVNPGSGAVWIAGYWGWGGAQRQWVPGRWEHARHDHPGYH